MKLGVLLAGFLLAGGLRASGPLPPNWIALFQDNFETTVNSWQLWGSAPPTAHWERVKAGDNTVYAGQGHAWLTPAGLSWANFSFRSRVQVLEGMISLCYRIQSAGTRYFVYLKSNSIELRKSVEPTPGNRLLAESAGSHPVGTWHEIEIVGVTGSLKVYVNGVLKLEATDADPILFGGIAFESLDGSKVRVDDVVVSGPSLPFLQPWVKTGGPLGGIGYDVRMAPGNPDAMYATDVSSGVSKSQDGGKTWFAANTGIVARGGISGDAIPVFSLTVDPAHPDTLWAGTRNLRGIYKSVDGGKNWIEKVTGVVERVSVSFRGFTVDPHNSNIVYAAADIGSAEWATTPVEAASGKCKGVVYRTSDGGENWTAIWRGNALARYVWIHPRNSAIVYISTGIFDCQAADSDVQKGIRGGVGIVKTTDGGKTWTAFGATEGLAGTYVGSLFMHPHYPDVLLAGVGDVAFGQGKGAYLSTDGGQRWQRTLNGDLEKPPDQITSVEFASSDPNIAYAAGFNAFYRSVDRGRTWRIMSGGPLNNSRYGPAEVRMGIAIDLQVDPRDPDRVFLNSYGGGNFLTEDGGVTWRMSSAGYTGAQLRDLAVDPTDPGRVLVIGRSGIFRGDQSGTEWHGLSFPPANYPEYSAIAMDPSDPSVLLAADDLQADLLLSRDGGRQWRRVHRGIPPYQPGSGEFHGYRALAFAPSNSKTIYAGMSRDYNNAYHPNPRPSYGIWKSADGGETWREANDEQTAKLNVVRIVVHPQAENIVYAAAPAGGVFRSRDGGASWRPLNQGLPSKSVYTVAMDPSNPLVLYAGMARGGIYKTSNGGESWQMSAAGIDPQASIQTIVFDPTDANVVFAGSQNLGVWRSEDGGKLWIQVNQGLRMRAVAALSISSDGSTLYAATDGEGIYRLDLRARSDRALAILPAASFLRDTPVAPESIVSLYGTGLAATLQQAGAGALPTTLGDTRVGLTDANGFDFWVPLYFVSATQINFLVPAGPRPGAAQVRVFRQNRVIARGTVQVDAVAPGLFTANANGQGVPAALAARYASSGAQTSVPVFRCGASCDPVAMDLGTEGDHLILMLFGTGLRAARSIIVTIGGVEAPVLGFAAQSQYAGLDQVNVRVPRGLRGRGEVELLLQADGKPANTVKIRIQ